jgi:hypothetical protein
MLGRLDYSIGTKCLVVPLDVAGHSGEALIRGK